jgi:hypothetical protein
MKETLTSSGALWSFRLAFCIVATMAWLAISLGPRVRQVRGTTLVAPWVWGTIAFFTVAVVEVFVALSNSEQALWAQSFRYAAAMGTFCPIVALLGAKRPQNIGWQWIVLSLWAILCQPSVEWMLFGGIVEIHPARFWFLVILILVGATNGIGTRNWLASTAFGAGQIILLLPYFSTRPPLTSTSAALWGQALIFTWGLCLVLIGCLKRSSTSNRLDRAWLDFRDEFGVVWSLRIIERVNAAAAMYDWPTMLTWHGFETRASTTYTEVPPVVEESFRTLLRRFVSPAWIDQRVRDSSPSELETVA